jgi:hypothetical protein
VHTLAECEWVQQGQPQCLVVDSDTGRSHLLIAALGTEAALAGYRVEYLADRSPTDWSRPRT